MDMNIVLYQAPTKRLTSFHVPRQIAILLGTFTAVFVFGLHSLYVLPVIAVIYAVLVLLYKHDEYFLEIIVRHIRQPDYFHP